MVKRQYKLDISRLINLDSEIGAYWLGYFIMRASITKNGYRLQLGAPASDIGHLNQLVRDAGSTIIPRMRPDKCYVRINSKELCDFYDPLFYSPPNALIWPERQARHLIRGLWDSRGMIGESRGYLRVGIIGDLELLEWVQNFFEIKNKILFQGRSWVMRYQGRSAVEIMRILYLNQTRCLRRKFDKVSKYIFI